MSGGKAIGGIQYNKIELQCYAVGYQAAVLAFLEYMKASEAGDPERIEAARIAFENPEHKR